MIDIMAYFSLLLLPLFLTVSQFYTVFFVELGLLLFLPTLLLLPAGIYILKNIFPVRAYLRTTQFRSILSDIGNIFLYQLLYWLCIYIFLLTTKGYSFFADLGFWSTYLLSYHIGLLYHSVQDLIAGFGADPALILIIPPLIASMTLGWIYYWLQRLIFFTRNDGRS
jgi:hypothetical protein